MNKPRNPQQLCVGLWCADVGNRWGQRELCSPAAPLSPGNLERDILFRASISINILKTSQVLVFLQGFSNTSWEGAVGVLFFYVFISTISDLRRHMSIHPISTFHCKTSFWIREALLDKNFFRFSPIIFLGGTSDFHIPAWPKNWRMQVYDWFLVPNIFISHPNNWPDRSLFNLIILFKSTGQAPTQVNQQHFTKPKLCPYGARWPFSEAGGAWSVAPNQRLWNLGVRPPGQRGGSQQDLSMWGTAWDLGGTMGALETWAMDLDVLFLGTCH